MQGPRGLHGDPGPPGPKGDDGADGDTHAGAAKARHAPIWARMATFTSSRMPGVGGGRRVSGRWAGPPIYLLSEAARRDRIGGPMQRRGEGRSGPRSLVVSVRARQIKRCRSRACCRSSVMDSRCQSTRMSRLLTAALARSLIENQGGERNRSLGWNCATWLTSAPSLTTMFMAN